MANVRFKLSISQIGKSAGKEFQENYLEWTCHETGYGLCRTRQVEGNVGHMVQK